MAERIVIAEIDLDSKALVKNTAKIKSELDVLKASQAELLKGTKALAKEQSELIATGKEGSKQFKDNDKQLNLLNKSVSTNASGIKLLSKGYNDNVKALSNNTQKTIDAQTREGLLAAALGKTATSITEAREQTKILTKLRNDSNASTEEGARDIELLNKKLDENTEFVKENADGYLKLKLNIGNYSESIKEALGDLNVFNGGLTGFIGRAQQAGGAGNLVTSSLKSTGKALIGLTKSTLAFLATPIGLVIAALAIVFGLVSNAMNRSEEATTKLKVAFSTFGGIVNALLKFLEPLGEFLIDGLVAGFALVEEGIDALIEGFASVLSFLGFEDQANSVREFGDEIKKATEDAKRLAQAEANLEKEQRKSRITQLEFQKGAEKLRQIRDDESKSSRERIRANEELGVILKQQLAEEQRIAELALEVANLRIEAEGETTALLDAQAAALTEIADIQERIVGQQSEQLVNRISLLKEQAEKQSEANDLELAFLVESNRLAKLSAQERVDQDKVFADQEIENLRFRLNRRLITQAEFNLKELEIRNELVEAQAEVDQAELDKIAEFENRKKELTDELRLLREDEDQAREVLKVELQFEKEASDLEKLIEDDAQRTELLALLEEQRQEVLQGIKDKFSEASLKAFEETLKKENDAAKKAGDAKAEIERQVASILVGILGDSLGARLAGIAVDAAIQVARVQSTSAASQASNLAQATASAPPPLNAPFIGTAVAQNAGIAANSTAQTAKILSSAALSGLGSIAGKIKFAEGGIASIDGASHAGGGVPIFAGDKYIGEAEGDEGIGILNKKAFSGFMGYNNSFNGGTSSNGEFQGGGIITQAVRNSRDENVTPEMLADAMSEVKIAVAVEDIRTEGQKFADVENGADV